MEIEWDQEKDAQNRAKHGVGLGEAVRLEWVVGTEEIDQRRNYNEERIVYYGPIADRLYVCVYTQRGSVRRIISLRKANSREIVRYGI